MGVMLTRAVSRLVHARIEKAAACSSRGCPVGRTRRNSPRRVRTLGFMRIAVDDDIDTRCRPGGRLTWPLRLPEVAQSEGVHHGEQRARGVAPEGLGTA